MSPSIGQSCRELAPRLRTHAEALENSILSFETRLDSIPVERALLTRRFIGEAREKISLWRKTADSLDESDKASSRLNEFLNEIQETFSSEEGAE